MRPGDIVRNKQDPSIQGVVVPGPEDWSDNTPIWLEREGSLIREKHTYNYEIIGRLENLSQFPKNFLFFWAVRLGIRRDIAEELYWLDGPKKLVDVLWRCSSYFPYLIGPKLNLDEDENDDENEVCPDCGSTDTEWDGEEAVFHCLNCGTTF